MLSYGVIKPTFDLGFLQVRCMIRPPTLSGYWWWSWMAVVKWCQEKTRESRATWFYQWAPTDRTLWWRLLRPKNEATDGYVAVVVTRSRDRRCPTYWIDDGSSLVVQQSSKERKRRVPVMSIYVARRKFVRDGEWWWLSRR